MSHISLFGDEKPSKNLSPARSKQVYRDTWRKDILSAKRGRNGKYILTYAAFEEEENAAGAHKGLEKLACRLVEMEALEYDGVVRSCDDHLGSLKQSNALRR